MSGNTDLLQELKEAKSAGRPAEPGNVDGAVADEIPEQFANVYKDLFNCVDDRVGIEQQKMEEALEAGIHAADVDNITPSIIRQAIMKLKPSKTDVSGEFSRMPS